MFGTITIIFIQKLFFLFLKTILGIQAEIQSDFVFTDIKIRFN